VSRLPVAAFVALVVATSAAFFITQHLKVTTPLIAGAPRPAPAVINPVDGGTCKGVNHRLMKISFYLLHRSDDVDVYIVDQNGTIVRTLASGRHMRRDVRTPDGLFHWDGREDDGSVAPDGVYDIRVSLIHQGRSVEISNSAGPEPVTVLTVTPHPVVTDVTPSLIPQTGTGVTIHYTGSEQRSGTVQIYRTDLPGTPRLVKSFMTQWHGTKAIWNGKIHGRPAPQGTYLVGFAVTNQACTTGRFPSRLPPAPGSTPHAGVSVRYLAAQPPLTPVPAGSTAVVSVDAVGQPYRWALRLAGTEAILATGASRSSSLRVAVPPRVAGLYELTVRSGSHQTTVPLVVNATQSRPAAILVVLPALTWQGQNPVDDDGDGVPNTLADGGPIDLTRPLVNGLPVGFANQAAFVSFLTRSHLDYDLTTDLGLIDGVGPSLAGHAGVVLAGAERWLPDSTSSALRAFVVRGGHLLSIAVDSLRRGVTVAGGRAIDPTSPRRTDALGARPGAVVIHNRDPIEVLSDGLGIFSGTSGVWRGYTSYEPIASVAPPAAISSAAGTSSSTPSIVGYRLGRGIVVSIGLPSFGSSLTRSPDAQQLVRRLWTVLSA
jgi:FlgD Ig-like domain